MSKNPDLKGSSFTLSVLHLSDNQIAHTVQFLQEKIAQAPAFFCQCASGDQCGESRGRY